MSNAKDAKSAKQLVDAIGHPDRVEKIGSLYHWYYEATDGVVEFKLQNGKVRLGRVKLN